MLINGMASGRTPHGMRVMSMPYGLASPAPRTILASIGGLR